jgi:hypothetical protein
MTTNAITGATVVNITHNGDNNINLDEDESDDLFSAVTNSSAISPARKAAYARLEFLERKHAARNAEMQAAFQARSRAKKAKQAESDSQVGLGEQLFPKGKRQKKASS